MCLLTQKRCRWYTVEGMMAECNEMMPKKSKINVLDTIFYPNKYHTSMVDSIPQCGLNLA